MRISCSTRWCVDIPAQAALAAIGEAGFEYVDVVSADMPVGQAMLDAIAPGLPVSGLPRPCGLHWYDTSSPGRIRDGLNLAKAGGINVLTLAAGPRRQEAMQYFVQTLKLALASMSNDMSIELVNRCDSRLEQLEDFRQFFEMVEHPRVSVAIDAVEFHRASVNPAGAILELGDRMSRLVLGDMIGDMRVPLGEGEINIPAVIEHARRIGYNGWFVVDPHAPDINMPGVVLAREHEWLRKVLAQ